MPIVEPEVLMDGDHGIDRCYEVTEWVLKSVYRELYYADVKLEGTVLKPNMVVPGKKSGKPASVEEVAEKTLRVLKACGPPAVPGIAFLSGGQSDVDATAHLNAMNKIGNVPWKLTFSYGRALQAAPQKAWSGKVENVGAAQAAFAHRATMNGLARPASGRRIWRSRPPRRIPRSSLGARRMSQRMFGALRGTDVGLRADADDDRHRGSGAERHQSAAMVLRRGQGALLARISDQAKSHLLRASLGERAHPSDWPKVSRQAAITTKTRAW